MVKAKISINHPKLGQVISYTLMDALRTVSVYNELVKQIRAEKIHEGEEEHEGIITLTTKHKARYQNETLTLKLKEKVKGTNRNYGTHLNIGPIKFYYSDEEQRIGMQVAGTNLDKSYIIHELLNKARKRVEEKSLDELIKEVESQVPVVV